MKFGVEIEYLYSQGRAQAQSVLVDFFKSKDMFLNTFHENHLDTYGVSTTCGKFRVMRDGSVGVMPNRVDSCEFVTPPLEYSPENIELIQECVRKLVKTGAQVNHQCGIHVHIDGSQFKEPLHASRRCKNLVKLFFKYQDLLLKVNNHRGTDYCKRLSEDLLNRFIKLKNNTSLDDVNKAWYNRNYVYDADHYDNSRYHVLNLHALFDKGTIEFRLFDSCRHAGKIKSYIQFCHQFALYCINAHHISMNSVDFTENERFFMRTFLNQLGMIGEEYKTAHKWLEENLSGDPSFRYNNRDQY